MILVGSKRLLDEDEASQFAAMLLAGAPIVDAVGYFFPDDAHEAFLADAIEDWPVQKEVLEAIQRYTGGEAWHTMTDEARSELALRKHFNEMAYYLWTNNYTELDGSGKVKADTCRQALQEKASGIAGQDSPIARFYHDLLNRVEREVVVMPAQVSTMEN
tara:strand:+ start:416 stop:895 length:480 start_codon:yes stop_codon:yes gene_type:complete